MSRRLAFRVSFGDYGRRVVVADSITGAAAAFVADFREELPSAEEPHITKVEYIGSAVVGADEAER